MVCYCYWLFRNGYYHNTTFRTKICIEQVNVKNIYWYVQGPYLEAYPKVPHNPNSKLPEF